jgi:hypothetical protein
MEKKMYKFPSIEQFRNVIKAVNYHVRKVGETEDGEPIFDETEGILPSLNYRGSVKLHGTNGAIVFTWNEQHGMNYDFHAQSRKNIITPDKDNAGFATFVYTRQVGVLLNQIKKAYKGDELPSVIRVYGEWCGGNIQKGVAINGLEKFFVIFAIKTDDDWFTDDQLVQVKNPEENIHNILDFHTYNITIDFNNPKESSEKLAEVCEEVEKECPVGKAFGKEGVGEGIVWVCTDEHWTGSRYWFKVKGDKHQSSKTKKKVPVDIEKVETINEMVDNFLTESRLLQGIDYIRSQGLEISKKNTGIYLKWVYDDIIKEEHDTIVGNGFEPKEISSTISSKAKKWYFNKESELLGL